MSKRSSILRQAPFKTPPSLQEVQACPLWWTRAEGCAWREDPLSLFTTRDEQIYVVLNHELIKLEEWSGLYGDDDWMPCSPPSDLPPARSILSGARTALLTAREQLACLGSDTDDVHQSVLAVVDEALRDLAPYSVVAPRVVEGKAKKSR